MAVLEEAEVVFERLVGELAFGRDRIVSAGGEVVEEQRATCFQAKHPSIFFEYSGKTMRPHAPMTPTVEVLS